MPTCAAEVPATFGYLSTTACPQNAEPDYVCAVLNRSRDVLTVGNRYSSLGSHGESEHAIKLPPHPGRRSKSFAGPDPQVQGNITEIGTMPNVE